MKLKKITKCRTCHSPISAHKDFKGEYIKCVHCGGNYFVNSQEEKKTTKKIAKLDQYPKKKIVNL